MKDMTIKLIALVFNLSLGGRKDAIPVLAKGWDADEAFDAIEVVSRRLQGVWGDIRPGDLDVIAIVDEDDPMFGKLGVDWDEAIEVDRNVIAYICSKEDTERIIMARKYMKAKAKAKATRFEEPLTDMGNGRFATRVWVGGTMGKAVPIG